MDWPTIEPNAWPAVWSATAATASACTAAISVWVAYQARRSVHAGQLQSWMLAYVKEHAALIDRHSGANPFANEYYRYRPSREQNQTDTVAGLLIGVVDLMYRAGDSRAKRWERFIGVLEGPILRENSTIEDYASRKKVRRFVQKQRAHMKQRRG